MDCSSSIPCPLLQSLIDIFLPYPGHDRRTAQFVTANAAYHSAGALDSYVGAHSFKFYHVHESVLKYRFRNDGHIITFARSVQLTWQIGADRYLLAMKNPSGQTVLPW